MDRATLALLKRIEADTAEVLRQTRETHLTGPFLAAFNPASDLIWFNYAIPLPSVISRTVSPDHVVRLRELFRQHRRVLRFEFFESLWPDLAGVLETAGLKLQVRVPLMLCDPRRLQPVMAPDIQVVSLDNNTSDETLAGFIQTAKQTFGEENSQPSPEEIAEQREQVCTGRYRCALAMSDGRMAGVGTLTPGNSELAGVGTLTEYRRRGVASTISSYLIGRHFALGGTHAWLSAADEIAAALYRKIGFRSAGSQLNYIDESP